MRETVVANISRTDRYAYERSSGRDLPPRISRPIPSVEPRVIPRPDQVGVSHAASGLRHDLEQRLAAPIRRAKPLRPVQVFRDDDLAEGIGHGNVAPGGVKVK